MRFYLILLLAAFAAGCTDTAEPSTRSQTPVNSNSAGPMRTERAQSTIEHTTEKPGLTPAASNSMTSEGRWSQGGNPIDTAEFDKAVTSAEKALKAKPDDQTAKHTAADAYFKRGFALTEARQYAAALGDYRKALKLVPTHEESLTWEKQIIGIYEMMKKDYPKPGEEPPPLPFKRS